jgi:hypothetical protein
VHTNDGDVEFVNVEDFEPANTDSHDHSHEGYEDGEEPTNYAHTMRDTLRCFMWIHLFFFLKISLKIVSKCRGKKEYHL